jgi:hypothetical protein
MSKSIILVVAGAALIGGWLLWRQSTEQTAAVTPAPLKPVVATEQTSARTVAEVAQRARQNSVSSADLERAAYEQWALSVVDWLVLRGDAESLAAAASLLYSLEAKREEVSGNSPGMKRMAELPQRAAALAPSNAPIQWLAMSLCRQTQTCDPSYEAALRAIDPKNALGWLVRRGRPRSKAIGLRCNWHCKIWRKPNTLIFIQDNLPVRWRGRSTQPECHVHRAMVTATRCCDLYSPLRTVRCLRWVQLLRLARRPIGQR